MTARRLTIASLAALCLGLGPVTRAAAQAAPASQPASQPASRPAAGDGADRLQRLERTLRQVQREVEQLKRADRRQGARIDETQELVAAAEEEKPDEQKRFSIYGFFDVNFQKAWVSGRFEKLGADTENAFLLGNLNTYLDFTPLRDWRFLGEIRFLLNPIGATASYENPLTGEQYERVNTETGEPAWPLDRFDFGSIEIERALVTWSRFEWLNVSVGLFLTPYGIWNIDHGSPTRIPAVAVLYALGAEAPFPERQLGLWLHGTYLLRGTTLEADLTLSNGRGPAATFDDWDEDKGLGGRLALSRHGPRLQWKLGLSVYTGQYTDVKKRIDLDSGGIAREATERYREVALGADLSLSTGPVGLQAELLANWRIYDDPYRPAAARFLGLLPHPGLAADRVLVATYGLLWYRLPLPINLRPFAAVYLLKPDDNYDDEAWAVSGGLNWRIRGAVVLKLQYDHGRTSLGTIDEIISQLAVAF